MELERRVAIVTGAASGIGAAVARALCGEGATVALVDRDADGAQRVAEQAGDSAFALGADVTESSQLDAVFDAVAERCGQLDILVNSAGIFELHPFAEIPLERWQRVIEVNLTAPMRLSQRAVRAMDGRGGVIVNISSIAGTLGAAGSAAYCASKGGLEALTRAMAVELGPVGVRVNAVAPHAIETPMTSGLQDSEIGAVALAGIPAGRFGRAEEVAAAVVFLAGPRAAFVTGATVAVNGGASVMLF